MTNTLFEQPLIEPSLVTRHALGGLSTLWSAVRQDPNPFSHTRKRFEAQGRLVVQPYQLQDEQAWCLVWTDWLAVWNRECTNELRVTRNLDPEEVRDLLKEALDLFLEGL